MGPPLVTPPSTPRAGLPASPSAQPLTPDPHAPRIACYEPPNPTINPHVPSLHVTRSEKLPLALPHLQDFNEKYLGTQNKTHQLDNDIDFR